MKKILVVMALLFALTACSNQAAELYETAKFEERQNNEEHAMKLYKEIIEKYPESMQAKEAAERLVEIQALPAGRGK
jgi:outer membrane protein assembly factor BamD (BamD/ComL family)